MSLGRAFQGGCFLSSMALAHLALAADGETRSEAERQACLVAHGETQAQRNKGLVVSARDAARACAAPICPNLLRTDCVQWLADIDRSVPSVIFEVKTDEGDVSNVRVSVDDKLVAEKLDGKAIELDPGLHTFLFEHEGYPAQTQKIVIVESMKHRLVSVVFTDSQSGKPSTGQPEPVKDAVYTSRPPPKNVHRPIPVATYALGGLALGLTGGFFVLRQQALSNKSDLETSCAPFCEANDTDAVHRRLTVAYSVLAGATASAGAAVIYYLFRPEVPKQTPTVAISPANRGGLVEVRGYF